MKGGIEPLVHNKEKAAKMLGISVSHLRTLIKSGEVKVIRLGRRTFVSRKEIERIINGAK